MIINGKEYDKLSLELMKFDYCIDSKTGSSTFALIDNAGVHVGIIVTTSTGSERDVASDCISKATIALSQ